MNREQLQKQIFERIDTMMQLASKFHLHTKHQKNMPTRAQIGILLMVKHLKTITIKEIAERLQMTSSAATQLVDGLVKEGYLIRTEDLTDRRKMCVTLSEAGKQKLLELKELRFKMMANIFEPLSETELHELQRLQEKIIDHWETTWTNKK